MTSAELLTALAEVTDALAAVGARHYVGGSIASSVHGVPRTSIDADVVADLQAGQVPGFVARLADRWYVDEGRILDAIARRRSFNVIHLATMYKVDVFVSKGRPWDAQALLRARPAEVQDPAGARMQVVATAEDIVLAKLQWFREGGEVSERQWTDVIGVLKTTTVDLEYLRTWAPALGVADLLDEALARG